ncbi:syndecan-4 [Rhineura floridana]|uniref:syndecan-4 n=1 Tax=Rhineura floridana TaxID=261503 RepID=UPI002AC87402|nr:syndecan-4 [Rhineura floridana]
MQPRQPAGLCAAALFLLLLPAVVTESVRETETMGPQLYVEEFPSGALPDDEDSRPELVIDEDDYEFSGSGDEEGYSDIEDALIPATDSPMVYLDNSIPDSKKETKDSEPAVIENEIIVPKKAASPEQDDLSNKISMASTANGSIFERTEVLAALIAGGAVGLLLFAVFPILLLIYRMKKKDEGSYDLGKKPIYKKAPTNEFYA